MNFNESLNAPFDSPQWTFNEKRMLKFMLERDGISFMRYFFKLREGSKLKLNWHHYIIEYVLQAVLDGHINRLIINVAPGYMKTEIAVRNFIARGLALNARAKFIQTSYSDTLVQENSSKIKDTIILPEFQDLWPMKVRDDRSSNKRWFTNYGGGMMAVPSGGQITGFRAGRMEEGFTGAFIIDDPVKPDDAYSAVSREKINNRFNNTMRSRLAVENNPMVVIMQRIHENDLTGYLLKGGSGDVWYHLNIPTLFSEEILNKPYKEEYTHGKLINIDSILSAIRGEVEYAF